MENSGNKRHCYHCDRVKRLEEMYRVSYEEAQNLTRPIENGFWCFGCAADLPFQILEREYTWELVLRAP